MNLRQKANYFHSAMIAGIVITASFEEAINSRESEKWKVAMEDEIQSLLKMRLGLLLPNQKILI